MQVHQHRPFYKFPRTPHLEGSAVVDDDEVLTKDVVLSLAAVSGTQVVIQEKVCLVVSFFSLFQLVWIQQVDGTNVSVYFESEWVPVMQKRSGLLGTGEKAQYNVFSDWVYNNIEMLFAVLGWSGSSLVLSDILPINRH
jgi:hypothetical protein